jgi:hypothetical protein
MEGKWEDGEEDRGERKEERSGEIMIEGGDMTRKSIQVCSMAGMLVQLGEAGWPRDGGAQHKQPMRNRRY